MEVIQQILILYIVAGVGFALTKTKVFNDHTIKAMTTITANVGIPALTVYFMREWISVSVLLLFWTVVFAIGLYVVYRLIIGWGTKAYETLSA